MGDWILKYWVQVLFGGMLAGLGVAYRRIVRQLRRHESLEQGMQALLRDRIIQAYNYYQGKGYCPIYARENVEEMYKQYHNLGGNGTVTGLVEALMDMRTDCPP